GQGADGTISPPRPGGSARRPPRRRRGGRGARPDQYAAAGMEVLLLLVSFAIVLAGALLFTNAVEWIGHKLELGEGAVGSILAAVGTAMPETLIAIVALISATE